MNQLQDQHDSLPLVLIVDDNSTIRTVLAHTLRFGGFQPYEAANGVEAIAWLEKSARKLLYPSVILLDLAMPHMDGRAFLEWLQANWEICYPLPSVILMTAGLVDAQALARFPALKQIVSKPFHCRDLITTVRRWST